MTKRNDQIERGGMDERNCLMAEAVASSLAYSFEQCYSSSGDISIIKTDSYVQQLKLLVEAYEEVVAIIPDETVLLNTISDQVIAAVKKM